MEGISEMTTDEPQVLEMTRVLKAPIEKVWAAWADAVLIAKWMGPGDVRTEVHDLDFRVGGGFHWTMQGECAYPLKGTYLEIDEPNRLKFTWAWQDGDYAHVETEVTVTLKTVDGGTELTLVHEKLLNAEAVEKHTMGWTGCLASLADHVE